MTRISLRNVMWSKKKKKRSKLHNGIYNGMPFLKMYIFGGIMYSYKTGLNMCTRLISERPSGAVLRGALALNHML